MSENPRTNKQSKVLLEAKEIWRSVKGYPLRAFFICLLGLTFMNLDHSLFTFVLTEIMEEFNWTIVERGWYIAITFIIAGVVVSQLGVLADRVGRKSIIFWSSLVTPFLVVALVWAPSTLIFLFFRTLGFSAGGVQNPVNSTVVIEDTPPRYRGLTSGILQIGYPLGFFIASLIVPFVYDAFGWRYIFFIALIGLPYAWLVWKFLREPPAWQSAKEKRDRDGTKVSTLTLFQKKYRYKTLVLLGGVFLQVFAYGATLMLTAYFREAQGGEARDAIQLVGLSYGIGALGYILAAFVGEFFMTRRDTIVVWCWLGSIAFFVMIWWVEGWWATAFIFSVMTFFFYGSTAVMFTFLAENFPAEIRATAVSFSGSFGVSLGIAIGPLALSYVINYFDWAWAFTVCGVVPMFLAGVVFLAVKPVPREVLQ